MCCKRQFSSGAKYLGSFDSEGKYSGTGKLYGTSGTYYEGEWSNNQRNGYGKLVDKAGSVSEGIWQDDVLVKTKETIEQENREAEERRVAEERRRQEAAKQEELQKQKEKAAEDAYSQYIYKLILSSAFEGYNQAKSNSNSNQGYSNQSKNTQQKQQSNTSKPCSFCNKTVEKKYLGNRCDIKSTNETNPGYVLCKGCYGMGFKITSIGCDCPQGFGSCYDKPCNCSNGWIQCGWCNGSGYKN